MLDSELHFSEIPVVDKERSRFDRSFSHKSCFNASELIPLDVEEVLPGDTLTMDFSHVTRMTTPIAPVMDNAALEVYAFFVPNRLIWSHWKEFYGENNSTHWEQPVAYAIPQIDAPSSTGWSVGSLADYLGLPVGVPGIQVNHLPFRAYIKIWNDWFRDENLKDPGYFTEDETTVTGKNYDANTYDYVTDTECGALPLKVAKWHDYFTSALPEPQKGPDVPLPLGSSVPVVTGSFDPSTDYPGTVSGNPLYFGSATSGAKVVSGSSRGIGLSGSTGAAIDTSLGSGVTTGNGIVPLNLVADLSSATASTINQLRQAFAVQRFYEAQARGGSRYVEMLKSIFGVTSPDARQQRSEFLGAKRFPINIDQVLQTSATDSVTPQGNTAAYSCTIDVEDLCTYSATEHGYFFVLGCVRQEHSYSQGIEKLWSRKKFTDFYVPQFAHLGEMPILNKEIYAQGSSQDDEVFGYQEAWAEYRYHPNRVSGKLRPGVSGSLAIWHFGDYYTSLPMLSSEWIDETDQNIYRTLAVQNEPQFIVDSYFKSVWTRVMPLYSVPGLLDHF